MTASRRSSTPDPSFAETDSTSSVPEAEHVPELLGYAIGLGGLQVYLVEHGDDLEVGLDGQVEIGHRLRLHALGGVDHQQRPFAGGKAARDFVCEVDVPGSVDQVQLVLLARAAAVRHSDRLGLDGDPTLPLQVHGVEVLVQHLPRGHGVRDLEQAVGKGGLAVVYVGDYAEVANERGVHRSMVARRALPRALSSACRRSRLSPICIAFGVHWQNMWIEVLYG